MIMVLNQGKSSAYFSMGIPEGYDTIAKVTGSILVADPGASCTLVGLLRIPNLESGS